MDDKAIEEFRIKMTQLGLKITVRFLLLLKYSQIDFLFSLKRIFLDYVTYSFVINSIRIKLNNTQ